MEVKEAIADITKQLKEEYGNDVDITVEDESDDHIEFLVKKPIIEMVEEYTDNPGDPISIEEYDTVEEAEEVMKGMDAPSEWKSRYSEHYVFLRKKFTEISVQYDRDDDGDWSWSKDGKWKDSDDDFEDLGISKSFETRESGADELLNEAYFKLRRDVAGEYDVDGTAIVIDEGHSGKYGSVWIKDKDDNELGSIEIRIADHSYNPGNRSGLEDGFISVVIANTDETRDRFHGAHNLYFDSDDDYDNVVEQTKEKIQEILDGLDIEDRMKKASKSMAKGGVAATHKHHKVETLKETELTSSIKGHDMVAECNGCKKMFSYDSKSKAKIWECPYCKNKSSIA